MKKTILITGSTDGIGKLAAEKLAQDGHKILVHGRLKNIDQLYVELNSKFAKIDVLINNAGVFLSKQAKAQNGLDLRFMVNYVAPYYITNQLMPLIKKSADPRIINLSSAAQETVSIEALLGEESISTQSAYAQSKLAITMWSFKLGKENKELTVIPVNPGSLLNTKMVQEAYGKFWSSADKGANILQLLATKDKYKGLTDKYFDNDQGNPLGHFGRAHGDAYNQDLIDELIEQTNQLVASIK